MESPNGVSWQPVAAQMPEHHLRVEVRDGRVENEVHAEPRARCTAPWTRPGLPHQYLVVVGALEEQQE
eukprot:2738149-Pyramimonas_sp.AAC.1